MNIVCFLLEKTNKTIPHEYDLGSGRKGVTQIPIYRRADTGAETTLNDAPPGAIWRATWYEGEELHDRVVGQDGQSWCCKMPGGRTWLIDSRASNCGLPDDDTHNCWIRHGVAPNFTVDKNGPTCSAGAGSIVVPGWHGFLRNGVLEEC